MHRRFHQSIAAHARRAALALALLPLWASAAPASQTEPDLTGWWTGTYICLQGLTKLDLSITSTAPNRFEALFHFSALPSNPQLPDGCFLMQGAFDPASRRMVALPDHWLARPDGWVMVGLDGQVGDDGDVMFGTVTQEESCTIFSLRLLSRSPEPRSICGPPPIS